MEDVNLKDMLTIRDKFGVRVCYSDLSLDIEIPVAAVVLGSNRFRAVKHIKSRWKKNL
jgi:sialic acid synthase SpsE